MQNVPYSLFVAADDFMERCAAEDDRDIRHLGRRLTFAYTCPNCGPRLVTLGPEYPYCGANCSWTCAHCAAVMTLVSPAPVEGTPKKCMTTIIRNSS
jgi:hypothetical protein